MKTIGLNAARAAGFCVPLVLAACAANPAPVAEAPPIATAAPAPATASATPVDQPAPAATGATPGNAVAAPAVTPHGAEGAEHHEAFFDKFTLNENSLTGGVHVDAPCTKVWDVATTIESLQKWAPHLNLTAIANQKTATKRGDVINFKVERMSGTGHGQFILASPVPNARIQAVVVPGKGPWIRIQEWNLSPQDDNKKCHVDYNESYNELWVKHQGLEGSGYIAKVRDHHIHVVLRRMKFIAEGKDPGPADETTYLFEDAKTFPDKYRNAANQK